MALIKCPECGADISDQAASCIKCGRPMAMSGSNPPSNKIYCRHCGHENNRGSSECVVCAKSLEMGPKKYCPHCGTFRKDIFAKGCMNCGNVFAVKGEKKETNNSGCCIILLGVVALVVLTYIGIRIAATFDAISFFHLAS